MAARVGVSKPIGGSARGRRRVAAQQTNRSTLSVKEMSEELERSRQNEVSMRNKLRAVSQSVVRCSDVTRVSAVLVFASAYNCTLSFMK